MALAIKNGTLSLYYCFDVAHEIKLDEVKKVFGKKPETSQLVCERLTPNYVKYKTAPLLVRLGKKQIKTKGFDFEASVKAKLYDFGVVTVIYQFPIEGQLAEIQKLTSALAENTKLANMAKEQIEKLAKELADVLVNPQECLDYWEDYIIISAKSFDKRGLTSQSLLQEAKYEIAKILRCETENLSRFELENALKYILSYYENELVVVDWQAAFIYNPRQSYDVADVLEYATISLLELRAYGSQLDAALEKAYDDLNKKGWQVFQNTLQNLTKVKLDVTEVIDKVTDALQLTGDLYLAKVYRAAAQRFYLEQLETNLNEKLKTVESIYTMLFDKANNKILVVLEVMIVLLFILDILLLFVWK